MVDMNFYHKNNKYTKATVIVQLGSIIMLLASMIISIRADFDIKATLLSHRELHNNHLLKDIAYDHFRLLDQQRTQKLQEKVMDHERRLQNGDPINEAEHNMARVAKLHLQKLLSESDKQKEERYAELHDAIQSDHTLGIAELDFTRTGLL